MGPRRSIYLPTNPFTGSGSGATIPWCCMLAPAGMALCTDPMHTLSSNPARPAHIYTSNAINTSRATSDIAILAIATLAIPAIAALPYMDSSGPYTNGSAHKIDKLVSSLLATHSIALAESSATPIVNTSVGSFHGAHLALASGSAQAIFYGVPYAQPPIGALRFARPLPVNTAASAVHNNTLPVKGCYQPLDYGGVNRPLGGLPEDCLGTAKFCLGIGIERGLANHHIFISQTALIDKTLSLFQMTDYNAVATPMEPKKSLTKIPLVPLSDSNIAELKTPYRPLVRVGLLVYLAVGPRPDIARAVQKLCQFLSCYNYECWEAAKRLLRHIKGTREMKLRFGSPQDQPGVIYGFELRVLPGYPQISGSVLLYPRT